MADEKAKIVTDATAYQDSAALAGVLPDAVLQGRVRSRGSNPG